VPAAYAVTWHTANQSTIAWDAVNTLSSGEPIPAGDVIQYKIYLVTPTENRDNPTEIGVTEGLEFTITITTEGEFYPGVRAVRLSNGVPVGESEISWSDNPEATNENPFGIRYFLPPASITGMKVK